MVSGGAVGLGSAAITVVANTANFENSLRRSIGRIGALGAGIIAGVGITKFFESGISGAAKLETQIAKIRATLDDVNDIKFFDPSVFREVSNEFGVAAETAAAGVQKLVSSGVEASEATDAFSRAMKLAKVTGEEVEPILTGLSTLMNSFASQGENATTITDKFLTLMNIGQGEIGELTNFISTSAASFSNLNLTLDELVALSGSATLTLPQVRKVFTGLTTAVEELSDSTSAGGKLFQELTGQTFDDFISKGNSLTDTIEIIGKAVGKANVAENFGAREGSRVITTLLNQFDKLAPALDRVQNSAGVLDKNFENTRKTAEFQFGRLKEAIKNASSSIAGGSLPLVTKALERMADFFAVDFIPMARAGLDALRRGFEVIQPALIQFRDALMSLDIRGLINALTPALGVILGFAAGLVRVAGLLAGPIAGAINGVIRVLEPLAPIIAAVTAAYIAWNVAMKVNMAIMAGAVIYQRATVFIQGMSAATAIATVRQNALNAAIRRHPVAALVTALAALGTALFFTAGGFEGMARKIEGAMNIVKFVVVEAIRLIVNAAIDMASIVPKAADKAFGWIPVVGKATGALKNDVENFARGTDAALQAIRDKHISITWSLNKVDTDRKDFPGFQDALRGLNDLGPGVGPDGRISLDVNIPNSFGGGGFDVGGGGGGFGGGGAGGALDSAREELKLMMDQILDTAKGIAKEAAKASAKTIRDSFKELKKQLKEADFDNILKRVGKIQNRLIKLAKRRDKITKRLERAQDALRSMRDDANSMRDALRNSIVEMGNVTEESKGIGDTFLGIRNNLKNAIGTARRFGSSVQQLRKLGLNDSSLRQIIDAGPERGLETAKAILAAGGAGVKELNQLQKELEKVGNQIGNRTKNQFFAQGLAAAEGLVQGLKSKESAIMKQMRRIGKNLVKAIKAELKIKSPSGVFMDVGSDISRGLAVGMVSKKQEVAKASQDVSQVINFGPGSISVQGRMDDPRKGGIMAAQGFLDVVSRNDTAAKLAGVG